MTDHPARKEHRRLAFNAAAGGIGNILKVALNLVLLPIMARLLGPSEFGLYSMALPAVTFLAVLADGGLGTSLASEDEDNTVVWSTAFWFLLGTCTALGLAATVLGFVMGHYSGEPRLGGLTALLATSFILLALAIPAGARINRRGNLVYFSVGDFISNIVGAGVAVTMAYKGYGALSLAAQYVVGFAIRAFLINLVAFRRPSFVFDLSSLKGHFATGSSIIGGRMAEFSGKLMENFLFGRAFGTAQLGIFNFANQASKFLSEAPSSPLWSALYSHAIRNDGEAVANLHLRLTRLFATVLLPAAFLVSASSPQLIHVVLGDKWIAAAPIMAIIVPCYALNAVATQCGAILLANKRNMAMFLTVAGLALGRMVGVFVGTWLGPTATAWFIDVANVGFAIGMVVALGQVYPAGPKKLVWAIAPAFVSSAAAGLVCHMVIRGLPLGDILHSVLAIGVGGLTYLVLMAALAGRLLMSDFQIIRRTVLGRA